MRLFLAIELPPNVREHLVILRDNLKSGISNLKSQTTNTKSVISNSQSPANLSLTRDENLHITLKFLGEVDPRRLEKLVESLSQVRASGPIELFAQQIEFYPQRGLVRIIAAGFAGQLAALVALHRAIEQRAQHLGFEREGREYRPHTTLARARPILAAAIRKTAPLYLAHFPGPMFAMSEFALIESRLGAQGSTYSVLHRFGTTS